MKTQALLLSDFPLWKIALRLHLQQWEMALIKFYFYRESYKDRHLFFVGNVEDVCVQVAQALRDKRSIVTMIIGTTEPALFRELMRKAQAFFPQHPEFGVN